MTDGPDIRLMFTNDFFGGFSPARTSYGSLPGGRALTEHVDRLREGAAESAWIDGGDFSGGGVLAPATDGAAGWEAAAALGMDAAVPGNHEFDFGDAAYAERAARMPFPMLALDVPGAQRELLIKGPSEATAAVIGLCFAERRGLRIFDYDADHVAAAERVRDKARSLRGTADHIVLVVHDGVSKPHVAPPFPLERFCGLVAGSVDVVVGGHTLSRYAGLLGGVPYLQPWAFGAELAVVDISGDRRRLRFETVTGGQRWDGPGAELIEEFDHDVVGENPVALSTPVSTARQSFEQAVAQGLIAHADADIALVLPTETGCAQPARDGIHGYLPAGGVSRGDVFRSLPWPRGDLGDGMWAADLKPAQVDKLIAGFQRTFPAFPGVARRTSGGTTLISGSYRKAAQAIVGDAAEWKLAGLGLRDGLIAWVSRT